MVSSDSDSMKITESLLSDSTLVDIVSSSVEGINLIKEISNRYSENSFFEIILTKPSDFCNFEVKSRPIYLHEHTNSLLCIPKVMVEDCSVCKIVISEAHSLLAHLGASKTLDYLCDHVWWKDMVTDTKAYCKTCMTCLNLLSIPGHL